MVKQKILFAWSGGKDSAMALYELINNPDYEIKALLTTVTQDYDRISMHGVRVSLLKQQAQSLGLPLEIVYISKASSNEEYETKMKEKLIYYQRLGVSCVAFGDIFLEDLRKYREQNLDKIGMRCIFPVWQRNTAELAHAFLASGYKAILTCVDSKALDKSFAGAQFDEQFLSNLPLGIDPCGENGEFHSFVYDGPIFSKAIPLKKGEVVLRNEHFYYCDLIPEGEMLYA